MITLTPAAREQVLSALEKQEGKTALRLEARTNGTRDFSYSMKLIDESERYEDDLVVESGDLTIVLDPRSAGYLEGATIDFEDRVVESGFKFHNPNKPEVPSIGEGPRPDLTGPVAERVHRLIDTELNPAVAAHGGRMELVGVRGKTAFLSFGGGCHGCGMVDVTLKQGVEKRIREVVPEIEEVVDVTDHASGTNPYYS